jgi:SAM-dependent methyltransferase
MAFCCPFCGDSREPLLEVGSDSQAFKLHHVVGGGRRLGLCNGCKSTDRERLIFLFLRFELGVFTWPQQCSILHIAPEMQLMSALIAHRFHNYVCGDLHISGYGYGVLVRTLDIQRLPFSDSHFDLIICNHVLEHIPFDHIAIGELHRVLKNGGSGIIQVPIAKDLAVTFEDPTITKPADRHLMFGQWDHCRIYGNDYEDRLKRAGFIVTRQMIQNAFPEAGLIPDETIFVVSKH